MKKENCKSTHFVKFYPGLSYLLGRDEIYFLLHIMDIEYLRQNNYGCNWYKGEYMQRMQMSRYTFDRCVKKLLKLELIIRKENNRGNEVSYGLNLPVYNQLVKILEATYNYHALIQFFDNIVRKQGRSIASITQHEINSLKVYNSRIKKKLPGS